MINARHADATTGFPRLFDLRETNRASDYRGEAPALEDLTNRMLVVHPDAHPVYVEQYRRLATALHHAQVHKGVRAIMVASAVGAEGKTLTATNLALTLSRSFTKRVLLVDADLRKPSIHRLLGLDNRVGLSDLLNRPGQRLPSHPLSHTLSVITGGAADPDPVALLVSDAAETFLTETRDQFDWVIVDTPPVALFPDAELLARRLDACVMVVSAVTTATSVAAETVATLGSSRILGVVFNRAEPTDIAGGYGYGPYGYASSDDTRGHRTWWRSKR